MLKKALIILFSLIIFLFLTYELITLKLFKFAITQITKKRVDIEDIKIDFSESKIKINNLKIFNEKNYYYENLFFSDEIVLFFNLKTIFSDTFEFDSLLIKNPVVNLEIIEDIKPKDETRLNLSDNLNVIEKLKKNNSPKTYEPKKKDKNFNIKKVEIINAKANLKYLDLYKLVDLKLSGLFFSNVGNSSGSQHFKDVFKIILFDIYMRIPDFVIKKKLKKLYKL